MKFNLLLVIGLLVFIGLACSDASDDYDISTSSDEPRFVSSAPTPEPAIEPNNSPEYWATCCEENRYQENYDNLAPKDEEDLAEIVTMAERDEERFMNADAKAEYVSELEYALIFYSRAALKDEKYFQSATTNLERGIKFKADACDMAEHTLALLQKHPKNAKLISFLPAIRNALLLDLKEEQYFDVRKSYETPESWQDVYGTGVYAIRNLDYLSRIASKMGDKSGYIKWQRYIAEYHLSAHSFDGQYSENVPTISYEIYTKLGDTASAKKAAVLVGKKILGVYLSGDHNGLGHTKRTFGLPHDLSQANLWFEKGGLDDSQIYVITNDQRLKAIASLPSCDIPKECSTEEIDNKKFLENLTIESSS